MDNNNKYVLFLDLLLDAITIPLRREDYFVLG